MDREAARGKRKENGRRKLTKSGVINWAKPDTDRKIMGSKGRIR
jgi:hypothetical protein